MSRPKKIYRCSSCDFILSQWMGKCPQCNQWNTLVEDVLVEEKKALQKVSRDVSPMPFSSIDSVGFIRKRCGIDELDRVLGGGMVEGSFVLVGGDPGIGKSTIMLQMAHRIAGPDSKVLYVSGEESGPQIKIRGDRLGAVSDDILIYPEVLLERIQEQIKALRPDLVIIDSIQSVFSSQIDSPPGSMSQIRHGAGVLMEIAKGGNTTVFIIGHVTKDGWIAGPKMLEHMVDTVLYFEGDNTGAFRILRAVKNRFGTTGEIGVFEMKSAGLQEVRDPSALFINSMGGDMPGSSVMATIEGTRAFVVEVQSLVSKTSFSMPRRISIGPDLSRLTVLLAVMEKRAGIYLSQSDVVLNIAGGIKVNEPALDLPVVMAVASSALDKPMPKGFVCIGEIGLNGELRPVGQMESRVREAMRMGFTDVMIPRLGMDSMQDIKGVRLVAFCHIKDALEVIL